MQRIRRSWRRWLLKFGNRPQYGSLLVEITARRPGLARVPLPATGKLEQIGRPIADTDGVEFQNDPNRFRRLVVEALKAFVRLTDTMVDAAHEAVSFDGAWAIRDRSDFSKAVRAMVRAAMSEK